MLCMIYKFIPERDLSGPNFKRNDLSVQSCSQYQSSYSLHYENQWFQNIKLAFKIKKSLKFCIGLGYVCQSY